MKAMMFSAALLLTACASVPLPTEKLLAAESAIARANVSRGDESGSAELRAARTKLAAAREAVAQDEMLQATRLAEEARLDADLATARLEVIKAQFSVEAMRKGNEALRQQGLRNATEVAPIPIPIPEATPSLMDLTPSNGKY